MSGQLRQAPPRHLTVPVVTVATIAYAAWVVAAVMSLSRLGAVDLQIIADDVLFQAAFLGFPAVGGVLAVRRPSNPIGWLLLTLGALATGSWLVRTLVEHQLSTGGVGEVLGLAAAVTNALSPVSLLVLLGFLLVFPDVAPRGWQRWMFIGACVMTGLMVVLRLLRPGPLDLGTGAEYANPLGVEVLGPYRDLTDPISTLVGLTVLVAIGVVLARYWRADGIRRLQYKWVIAALAAAVALQVVTQFLPENDRAITLEDFASVLAVDVGLLGLCLAIAVAVTRHGLFELDRIVSRTLSWTIVSAIVLAIYAATVLALGAVVRALGGAANDLVVAASTLLAAVSVRPLLRRTRHVIDRRFDRARYDGAKAVDALSLRLRAEVDVDSVVADLSTTAVATMQPRTAWVWLAGGRA